MPKIFRRPLLATVTALLILSASLLLCSLLSGCERPSGGSDDDTSGTSFPESSPEPGTDTPGAAETQSPVLTMEPETAPSEPLPVDPSPYEGVVISMVYGTGKNNTDAAIPNGFVQLYNTTPHAVSLKGASLFYKSDGAKPYACFRFPDDAVIKAEGYYLVRANSPAGYDESGAVMTVDCFDAEWDVYIDNKEVNLILAPAGLSPAASDDPLAVEGAVSVFAASESYKFSVFAVDNLSKNRIAVRTAPTTYSGYHTRNLTEMTSADLLDMRPRYSRGVTCSEVHSRLEEVRFSFPAGVYDDPLLLELHAPLGHFIYYTLDGSDPRTSTTRQMYTGVILLDDTSALPIGPTTQAWANMNGGARPLADALPGAHVVRAYAVDGEHETAVFTNTYFIDDSLTLNNVTIVSMSIPTREMIGPTGFYSNYCPTGVITDTRPRGLAVMEVFDHAGKRVGSSNVELAVSGNGSSGWGMKSLRIYYKGSLNQESGMQSDLNYDLFGGRAHNINGEAITSFSRLLLRNSGNDCADSYIRDAYMQESADGMDVDYMATETALVFFNGEFWGVYNLRERYSPEYVESHYGVDKENVAVIESDYSQVHTNANAPYVLSSGIEGDQKPFNEMIDFMRSHSLADPANYEYVCSLMDIDSFIDMYAVRIFYVSTDFPNNNIKIWRNRNPEDPSGMDTKWHFTLLDLDMGLSWSDGTTEYADFFGVCWGGSVCGDMMKYLLANKDFKDRFVCRFYEMTNEYLTPERLNALFDRYEVERNELMPLQEKRWAREGASVGKWNAAVTRIRSFIANRQPIVLRQLYADFGYSEAEILNMTRRQITISYDDARAEVTCDGVLQEAGEVIGFGKDPFTFTVRAKAKEGYTVAAVVWTPVTGDSVRVDGDGGDVTASFTADRSGTVTVIARLLNSDPTAGVGGQLIAGATYLFYLDKNGDLYAWGDNRYGVLGLDSDQPYITVPTLVMHNVAKVATTTSTTYNGGETNFTTAILTKDGILYTVGVNSYGQLGRNGTTNDNRLAKIDKNIKVKDVAVGNDHLVIVDTNNVMYGVGHNNYKQLGTGCGEYTTSFVKVATGVTAVSAGRRCTTLIRTDGHLYGLGDNRWEKLVDGAPDILTEPTLMMKNVAFCASGQHQCAFVTETGTLYYAGWRPWSSFQQGSGNDPTAVKVMDGVDQAYLFIDDMVILCKNGDAYVYGLNTQNSIGGTVTGGTPKRVAQDVVSVAVGYGFSAYLYKDGTICVQGDNAYGQAGNGLRGGSVTMSEVFR